MDLPHIRVATLAVPVVVAGVAVWAVPVRVVLGHQAKGTMGDSGQTPDQRAAAEVELQRWVLTPRGRLSAVLVAQGQVRALPMPQ